MFTWGNQFFFDLPAFFHIYRIIKRNNIKIVHTHSSKAGVLARWAAHFAGVPTVIHSIHGWGFYRYKSRLLKTFFIFLESITAKITDKLIAVTQADIDTGLKYSIGTGEQYRLIPYGIDREGFQRVLSNSEDIRAEFAIDKDTPLVGMVACFKPQKDHATFIKAAAKVMEAIPEAMFLLVGDGVMRSVIEAQIAKQGLQDKVMLTGWRRDIPRIMASIDLLVLSTFFEGLPIVILEAQAAAKPVVVTDVCGVKEIVRDGETGYLVPPADPDALADKIIVLLKDKDLRQGMAQAARSSFTEEFEQSFMLKKINNLYE